MNVNNYREFLERIGHHIIESESGYWFNQGLGFYESIPPFALINPSEDEIRHLFWRNRVAGIKYCTDVDKTGLPSFLYICEDKSYDLNTIWRKKRNRIRKGIRECHVCQIDFKYLQAHGIPLNEDTMARQKRSDLTFSDPAKWKRFCQAASQVEGALTWGAFVGNKLAAYMVVFIIDGYCNILHQMSCTALLSSNPNEALTFIATKEMLSLNGINCVSYGHESIRDLDGLDEYKVKMGYKKHQLHQVVKVHPFIKTIILSSAGQLALNGLEHLLPNSDFLKRTRGIINVAQHCRATTRRDFY